MIVGGLLAIDEMIVNLHQDSNDETTTEVHLVKKVGHQTNHLVLKKNLVVTKKNPLGNLQRNFKDLDYRHN